MALPSDLLSAALSESGGKVRIAIRVQPGARRDAVLGMHGDRLRIAVQAPPVDGKANAAIERYIAELLGIPARRVVVAVGHGSRDKRVDVEAGLAEVAAAFGAALAQGTAR